jgi:MFS family permease
MNFGYSIGVFNSLMFGFLRYVLEIDLKDENFWSQLLTGICTLGAAVGALSSGPLTRFGKKNCIHFANIVLIVGCGLTLIQNIYIVVVGRFLFGLAAGSFTVFVPSFINELTPTELKGPFGSATQLLVTFGILVSNLLGIPLPSENDLEKSDFIKYEYWRVLFALPIVFAIVQEVLLFTVFNYETPKYLKQIGKKDELQAIMNRIYSPNLVQERIDAIQISSGESSGPSYKETLCSPKYRIATLIGCALSLC